MTSLTQTKAELVSSLEEAGWPVRDHVPSKIQPPIVILGAGDPYIVDADTFGGDVLTLNLEIYVLPKSGTNAREVADLDRMLEALIPLFGDWSLEVGQPELVQLQGNVYLSAQITASHPFTLSV